MNGNGPQGGDAVAEIRIADRRSEMFVADACRVTDGWIHAEGCWRTRVGANHADVRWSDLRSYSWPASAVHEVRWQRGAAP
jgi:hypothetical protein